MISQFITMFWLFNFIDTRLMFILMDCVMISQFITVFVSWIVPNDGESMFWLHNYVYTNCRKY
jgi:hypothetical protein